VYRNFSAGALGIRCSFEESLDLARGAGFQGADLDFFQATDRSAAESVAKALADRGLCPGTAGLPVDFRTSDENYRTSFQRFRAAAPLLAATGVRRVLTWLLPFSDDLPYLENFRRHADRLTPVAEVLAENGIRFGLEFVGTLSLRQGHKFPFVHTLDQVLELAGAIERPNVGILLDSWHWYVSGGTVEEIRKLSDDHIVGVHVNDAPAGIPIEQQQDNVRCLPGETGVIDLVGFLKVLEAIGYGGPVTVEPFSSRLATLPAEQAARQTSEALVKVWRQAEIPDAKPAGA